ncbi:hypothetical protein ESY86_12015 [Subsaximicrobium wynnwilliamsii]|jgi:hypothetical protein|uniref:DUF2971 domain-containing protein n=1 Tax=Subsaximicrobium wynnwilliamsii TaxID=291179 RepID=A0A5C6ZHF0_9FLAO|nr:hypothetical protein [Subsaximicrobium wynnwilliamsii]TXD82964.1 hypothetical protein ESY87_12050 [Subsaximicrobium wynnwilliamsii]TXD88685.1 hypothetical protein ESY86_12015 [Subsaximicrobium wynnwilliamsii]TXE02778.1 hypothetical protein ESY88_11070 [Subsaximicrobium wynnwilliamsii]
MIVTPLDSAILDSKEQYVFYHKMLDFALKELISSVKKHELCTQQELIFFNQYCDLLSYSIEAMRVKYMYDQEDNMKVDLTKSGLPNYLEFRYLFNDLSLKGNYLNKLKDVSELQEEFLTQLLHKKQPIKKDKLFEAASIVYYTSVEQKFIFNRFVQGKIIDAPEGSAASYMTSWSFYDVSNNRPYVCFMYFDYEGKSIESYKQEIYEVLKSTADRDMDLDIMAYGIDRKLPDIQPKHIKRIDLGPFHNVFAKDGDEVTHVILENIANKNIPLESYAVALSIDEVISGSQFTEGGYFSKQTLQKWKTVQHKKYVFAPHRIIQLLYSKTPEIMGTLEKPPFEVSSLQ